MSFYQSLAEALQDSRVLLTDMLSQQNYPRNLGKRTGMMDFLFTPENQQNFHAVQQDNAGKGQYRPVQIKWMQRETDEDVVEDLDNLTCDPGNDKRFFVDTYQPEMEVGDKITVGEDYIREALETPNGLDAFMRERVMEKMRVLRERMDSKLLAKAGTNKGTNIVEGNSNYTSVELLTNTGAVNFDIDSFDKIAMDLQRHYINGNASIVASVGGIYNQYMNRLDVGAANDAGVNLEDVMSKYGMAFYKDHNVANALGAFNNLLAFVPSYAQFYAYNLNRGQFAIEISKTEVKGTMPDPVYPGLLWDYDMAYDRQCNTGNGIQGAYVFRLWCYFDLFTPPANLFSVYDELEGFNGILGYTAAQGA